MRLAFTFMLLLVLLLLVPTCSLFAQASSAPPPFGLGFKASTLGAGVEGTIGVASRSNARLSFNAFNYSHGYGKDGISYNGKLRMRSFQMEFDQYVLGGFHVGGGAVVYNENPI